MPEETTKQEPTEAEALAAVEARWDAFIDAASPLMKEHKLTGAILVGLLTESGEPGPRILVRSAGALPKIPDEATRTTLITAVAKSALSAITIAAGGIPEPVKKAAKAAKAAKKPKAAKAAKVAKVTKKATKKTTRSSSR